MLPLPSGDFQELGRELDLSSLAAKVLVNRGFDVASARQFLDPSLDGLHEPFLMRDMESAVERVWSAIQNREKVLLYGDYDVDGTSSVVVLKKAIEILGGCASFHIPHRLKDGYGMRSEVIDRAAEQGVKLIISVDTGIRAADVVRHAKQAGVDVIVTDHHLPEAELPPALAVLNPNRADCGYPNKNLCGAGVTLKLVQALLRKSGMADQRANALLGSFLKPVAIATVADIVPLTGENRVIVQQGLSGLRRVKNLGLQALMAVAGLDAGEPPSAHQVAFRIAPRMNAAGRMATAMDVIELLLTEDAARAREIATHLDSLNRERQQTEAEIVNQIIKQCESQADLAERAAFVFWGDGWHLGVLGIVASRLVERLCRPVFVLSQSSTADENLGPHLSGSGRSIPAFHLLEALETMPDLFAKYGGHRQAAGVTLRCDRLADFQLRLQEHAANVLSAEDMRPSFHVDAECAFADFTERSVADLQRLGPFGFGNTLPIFLVRGADVAAPARAMSEGKHLSLRLRHQGKMLIVKAWNFGDCRELLDASGKLDVLIQVEDDAYSKQRGYGSWCLMLKDARPAA